MPGQLVIQLARFGDLLQTARLLDSLARRGETHLVVDRSLVPLARLVYPDLHVHGLAAHAGDPVEVLAWNRNVFAQLRALDPDAVYNLNHSGMNRALGALFAPEVQRGYMRRNGQALRERWVKMAFRSIAHRRTAPLNLMDFWGLLAPEPLPPDQVNPAASAGGKGLGVVLAGKHARRSLPPETLALCARVLCERLGGTPIWLLGTEAERPAARKFLRSLSPVLAGKTTDLTGRTDWAGLLDAVRGLDALLSPDTGTMHLGARLGVPVRALFLSSAWVWETGPYGLGHTVWQGAPNCAPCLEAADCDGRICLELFKGREVLRSLAGYGEGGKTGALQVWESAFDALGLTWNSGGEDIFASPRRFVRRLIAAEAGVDLPELPILEEDRKWVETFYHEADWMLPDVIGL